MHLVDKHFYPRNYDFFIVIDGVDPRRNGSMLRPAYRHKVQAVSSDGSSTLGSIATNGAGKSMQEPQGSQGEYVGPEVGIEDDEDSDSVGNDYADDDHGSDDLEDGSLDEDSADEVADGNTKPNRSPKSINAGSVHSSRLDARARPEEAELADLTSSMSALKFVPPSVRFGRGTRSGFARRQ